MPINKHNARPVKIAVLGSSVSIQKKGYLPEMTARLKSYGVSLEILNASLGGTATEATLAYISENLFYDVRGFSPDIIIIEKGPNERHLGFSSLGIREQSWIESRIYNDTKSLAELSAKINATPVLMSSLFKDTVDYSTDPGQLQGYISRAYQRVADELGILHLDPASSLDAIIDNNVDENDLYLDDVHLSELGANAVGGYAASHLYDYLKTTSSPLQGEKRSLLTDNLPFACFPSGGVKESISTSLIKADYSEYSLRESAIVELQSAATNDTLEVIGLFIVSDQNSGWIRISSENGSQRELCLFDHMSFYPRIHYIRLDPPIIGGNRIAIEVLSREVETEKAVIAYNTARTFDPTSDWAKAKYLTPLLEAQSRPHDRKCKIIAIIARKIPRFIPDNLNCISFFESKENVFMLDQRKHSLVNIQNVVAVGGIGNHSNSHIITDNKRQIVIETSTEPVLWRDVCLHRVSGEGRKSIEVARRLCSMQREITSREYTASNPREQCCLIYDSSIWLAHAFGWYAFGHLFDSLQRLFYTQSLLESLDNYNLIVSRSNRIQDFELHLKILMGRTNHSKATIVELEKNTTYYFESLYYPSTPSTLTSFSKESYEWILSRYQEYFHHSDIPVNKRTRLYLSRNHIRDGQRGVVNERVLVERLQKNGYVVLTGSEPLEMLFGLFSRAEVVIGPHGSLFANTIFCPEDCRIIEFCPSNRVDKTFARKYKRCNNYTQLLCAADNSFNIKINPDFAPYL